MVRVSREGVEKFFGLGEMQLNWFGFNGNVYKSNMMINRGRSVTKIVLNGSQVKWSRWCWREVDFRIVSERNDDINAALDLNMSLLKNYWKSFDFRLKVDFYLVTKMKKLVLITVVSMRT